jgi:hypothetical protein
MIANQQMPTTGRVPSGLLHPALIQLLRYQSNGRVRRLIRRLASPRRLVLSCIGLALAILWLGNAALSILFRQAADPGVLQRWLPLGLFLYGLWHVVKVAYRRPDQGIEWTAAERENLGMAPFSRQQLLAYRFVTVLGASLLKAACFTVLMLPDLRLGWAGFCGALLALLFLEMWRTAAEIFACEVRSSTYRKLRVVVLGGVAVASLATVWIAVATRSQFQPSHVSASLAVFAHLAKSAALLQHTWLGTLFVCPFQLFSQIILAEQISLALFAQAGAALILVLGMLGLAFVIDRHFVATRDRTARRRYDQIESLAATPRAESGLVRRAIKLSPNAGWKALAWRQILGAWQYWPSVLIALVAPTVLSLLPLFIYRDPVVTMLHVTGSLALFSMLLLPPALRFDFRRDVDRMALLKTLPIKTVGVVTGQLLVPVVIASVFQLLVLIVAVSVRPLHPGYVASAWLLLVLTNVLVFALDNLIFLLFPHRPNQEGLEIFLRTTLTFTAKGLMFGLALGFAAAWALLAGVVAHQIAAVGDPAAVARCIFAVGVALMLAAAAVVTMRLNMRAFQRYDPSQDTPA